MVLRIRDNPNPINPPDIYNINSNMPIIPDITKTTFAIFLFRHFFKYK